MARALERACRPRRPLRCVAARVALRARTTRRDTPRIRHALLLVAVAPFALAACGPFGANAVDPYAPPADPHATRLGAHTLLAQGEGAGISPAVTSPISTQPAGSALIAFNAGYAVNESPPTDSQGNLWTALGPPVVYAGYQGRFDVKAYLALHARGGAAHTLSVVKNGNARGELTLPFIEIRNAGRLQDVASNYAPAARTQRSARVTTTGPALLLALWWGDGAFLEQSARPSSGFAVIENFVRLPEGSAVQCVVAVRNVEAAGTYDVEWSVSPAQRAPLWLLAFERDATLAATAPPH